MRMTQAAALKICEIALAQNIPPRLRLTVDGGGCSGFRYSFSMAGADEPADATVQGHGAELITDETSLSYLRDAELDYEKTPMGEKFSVTNPHAVSGCGCGSSFYMEAAE